MQMQDLLFQNAHLSSLKKDYVSYISRGGAWTSSK